MAGSTAKATTACPVKSGVYAVTVALALETLGSAQRQVIEMAYFSGLTQMEIARRTGAPLGTVKSRARLGLLALRAAIAPEPYKSTQG